MIAWMRRLDRMDTLMLDLESRRCPMHTLKIAVVKPASGGGFEEARDSIAARVEAGASRTAGDPGAAPIRFPFAFRPRRNGWRAPVSTTRGLQQATGAVRRPRTAPRSRHHGDRRRRQVRTTAHSDTVACS